MPDKQIIINKMDKPKRYCEGIDCAWSNEKEPCIYKIANELEEKLLRKEQECDGLKKELHKKLKEKDILHLIVDRLLEASGYDTNTASAEDFEDVYENMRYEKQQLDKLKAENKHINDLLNQA